MPDRPSLNIAFFGSSLISAYWNGAATYYRGLLSALYARGHRITFFEPDVLDRQRHRDIDDPVYARVVVYPPTEAAIEQALMYASRADVVIKASGVGTVDDRLDSAVLELQSPDRLVLYWDVDAPATLDRLSDNPLDPFHRCVARYDLVLTYGGGDPVIRAYRDLGAQDCIPIYNAVDPATHYPQEPVAKFQASLAFLGNRLPDREERVDEFFFRAARLMPDTDYLLGGSGWHDKSMPANVRYVGHVYTRDHNALNCSAMAILNISRQSMARYGFSPATRVFEVAGAGACLITDAWEGIELFLEPGSEVLVAHDGDEVAHLLKNLTPAIASRIGRAARRRVLAQHTYAHRAQQVESLLVAQRVSGTRQPISPRAHHS
jgi:spore maturation protein CgeB